MSMYRVFSCVFGRGCLLWPVHFLGKTLSVVLAWLDWLVFCEYGFSVFALWCPLATPTDLLGFLLLIEFCQENALVITNTLFQQHKRRLYMWTSLDGQHWNQVDYILCSWRWRSSIQSVKRRPGADCGSDHELLIAKFRLKLNKVGKTTDHSGMT